MWNLRSHWLHCLMGNHTGNWDEFFICYAARYLCFPARLTQINSLHCRALCLVPPMLDFTDDRIFFCSRTSDAMEPNCFAGWCTIGSFVRKLSSLWQDPNWAVENTMGNHRFCPTLLCSCGFSPSLLWQIVCRPRQTREIFSSFLGYIHSISIKSDSTISINGNRLTTHN